MNYLDIISQYRENIAKGFKLSKHYLPELIIEMPNVDYEHRICYAHDQSKNEFGVFDTLDADEEAFDKTRQLYFEEELEDPHTNVEKIEDVDFQIKKVKLNENIDELLGGYAE